MSPGPPGIQGSSSADAEPDLPLTDIVLPDGTGIEVAERLRAGHPGLPVVSTSGYSPDDLSETLEGEPGTVFLQKPYDPESLAGIVRRTLDERWG